jgi:nucleoid DNA-binding protein
VSVLGKREMVQALIIEGFSSDEASRAYETFLETIRKGLRKGRTIYFRRICKLWPVTRPPRKYWDNWNQRYVYFGERKVLKVKPFFLKDRNLLAERKIAKSAKKITAEMAG